MIWSGHFQEQKQKKHGKRETIGIDHAALGSDFDGWIYLPDDMRDVRDMPLLTQLMLNRGYSHEYIKKVLGLNFLRVYKEACG